MHTRCPDCQTAIRLENPGTDPAATSPCSGCGATVRPGAFRCPGCDADLQVDRALLPADGGRGRCPACAREIDVPALPSEPAATAGAAPVEPPGAVPTDDAGAFDLGSVDSESDEEAFDLGSIGEMDDAADAIGSEDASATGQLDAAALGEAVAAEEAGATMRLAPGSIAAAPPPPPVAPPTGPDAGATMRLDPGSLTPPEPPGPGIGGDAGAAPGVATGDEEDEDTGSTRRLDLSKLEVPGADAAPPPAPAPPAPAAPTAPPPLESIGLAGDDALAPMAPQRPKRSPSATRSRPPTQPPPAPSRSRGVPALLGLLLGALLLGGGSYAVMVAGIWTPAAFPMEEMIPLPATLARSAILGVAGALLGLLLGALLGGGRRR